MALVMTIYSICHTPGAMKIFQISALMSGAQKLPLKLYVHKVLINSTLKIIFKDSSQLSNKSFPKNSLPRKEKHVALGKTIPKLI